MKNMKKIGMVAMAFVMALGISVKAEAVPVLTLFDGTTSLSITDGGAGDESAIAGTVQYSQSIGNWDISLALGVGSPAIGTSTLPQLHLNNAQFTIQMPAVGIPNDLQITLSDSVAGPLAADGFISTYGGITTDGTVRVRTYANGNLIVDSGAIVSSPFSGSGTNNTLFGLSPITLLTIIDIHHPGTQVFESTSLDTHTQPVPEPGTMLLLGSGLVGVAFYSRRKKA